MKGDHLSQRATQALQPFRHLGTPVEDYRVASAQREELIPLIGNSIRAASVRQIRWRRGKRALGVAAVAAGFALLVSQGYRLLTNDHHASAPSQQASSALLSSGKAVSLTRQGQPIGASEQPRRLLAGDQIATPPNAPRSLVLIGGARVEVAPSTQITLARTEAREQRLELTVGRVELEVPKLAPGNAFVVQTPHAEVRVRGTRFSVEVSGSGIDTGSTRVGVSRGSVLVRTVRGDQLLSSGETWSSLLAATTRAKPTQDLTVGRTGAGEQPERSLDSSPGELEARGGKAQAVVSRSAKDAAPVRRAKSVALASDPGSGSSEAGSPARVRTDEGSAAPTRVDSAALAQQNGLMQAALAARKRGDHARAVRLLDELLRRHPSSPLAESARVERFRSLGRLGRHAEATREARRYLASYGRGFARDEARGLVLTPETAGGSTPKR